jgi:hypothetical protein
VLSKSAEANWEFNRQKKGKTCKAAFHPMTLSSSDEYHLKVCFIRIEKALVVRNGWRGLWSFVRDLL